MPVVETEDSFVEDAARLERASGALSASVARLALAGRSLPPSSIQFNDASESGFFDKLLMSDEKDRTPRNMHRHNHLFFFLFQARRIPSAAVVEDEFGRKMILSVHLNMSSYFEHAFFFYLFFFSFVSALTRT